MKALALISWMMATALLMGVCYHLGHLTGKSDLDRWMESNNVHRFMPLCKGDNRL